MSTEKLPPDGYELGPGWEVIINVKDWGCSHRREGAADDCNPPAVYGHSTRDQTHPDWMSGSCARHAEAMGAIVRKAEEPTFDRVLADATEALAVLGTGKLRTELVTEGPRSFEQLVGTVGPLASTAMASAGAPAQPTLRSAFNVIAEARQRILEVTGEWGGVYDVIVSTANVLEVGDDCAVTLLIDFGDGTGISAEAVEKELRPLLIDLGIERVTVRRLTEFPVDVLR